MRMSGERRGPVPEEELKWLRSHLKCRSINQLFADYSEAFCSPYSSIISFRRILVRHQIFPITEFCGLENVNRMLTLYAQGPVHWEYKEQKIQDIMTRKPHWLWSWHEKSIRTSTGVMFKPYPVRLKEKQFEQRVDSRDPHQGSEPQRVYQCLSDELPQGEQDEARCASTSCYVYKPFAEDEEADMDRLPLDGEEQPPRL